MDPEKVWSDYVEEIGDVLDIVKETNLKATFDTAHFALNKKDFDLIEGVKAFGDYLYHLHVCDIKGYWIPKKSLCQDGVIPGRGEIGERKFKEFFKYIANEYPNIGVVAEARVSDFKNPFEFKESVKKICEWINTQE